MENLQHSLPNPFQEGKTLILNVNKPLPLEKSTIEVKIVRLIKPSTLSCVMEVEGLKFPGHSILKLYDWRYATQMRESNKVGLWTRFHENSYRAFVEKGDAAKFSAAIQMKDGSLNNPQDGSWNTAQNEVYLFEFFRKLHTCETKAYNILKNLQGKNVPRLLADVHLDGFSTKHPFFKVQGIMIELIKGYTLSDLVKTEPRSACQNILDAAVRTVNLIGDHGILNQDVNTQNFLVKERAISSAQGPEIILIDLAMCKFRQDYVSDAAWKHVKFQEDEEGAIGHILARKMKGAVKYKPSYRYLCYCSICTDV